MHCPSCEKEVVADRLFCTWCESYLPNPSTGTKPGLFRRWFASIIDPFLIYLTFVVPPMLSVAILGGFVELPVLASLLAVGIVFFKLFNRGMTPGKYLFGEQVVDKLTGGNPGFAKMLVRETVGKFLSAAVFGLGFFWAIWDKDSQAWHDKIAGTVVVRRRPVAAEIAVPREVTVPSQ